MTLDLQIELPPEAESEPSPEPPSRYVVRYGATRFVGEFSVKNPEWIPRHTEVIVRSDRGVEWGEVLCPSTEQARQHLGKQSGKGRILRRVTENDRLMLEEIHGKERDEFQGCGEMIAERKLQMDLVDVEHLFGGERIVFYYLAEERVDFRELVKALAKAYRTRIEMRQIGVRDEARLLADYGDCGRPVCCNTHLSDMPHVSMKMAKVQKATLDPTKISGRCGRLKCCLRYEFETYDSSRKELPRNNTRVLTREGGEGRVVDRNLLLRQLVVEYGSGKRTIVNESEIVTVLESERKGSGESKKQGGKRQSKEKPDAADGGEGGS